MVSENSANLVPATSIQAGRGVGPGRPRSERASSAILDATFSLLAESGYAGVSVDAIARRASVSKATLYRRWPTKAVLVVAALGQAPPLEPRAGADLESDLVGLIEDYLEIAAATPLGVVLPALLAESVNNSELSRALAPLIRDRAAPIRTAFERGVARGELAAESDLDLAVRLCLGPFVSRVLPSHDAPGEIRLVVRIILAGLRHEATRQGDSLV